MTVCAYIGYLPQVFKLVKTKSSKDLSLSAWIIWVISTACGTAYSILLMRPEMIVMYVSEFIISLLIVHLIVKYRR